MEISWKNQGLASKKFLSINMEKKYHDQHDNKEFQKIQKVQQLRLWITLQQTKI